MSFPSGSSRTHSLRRLLDPQTQKRRRPRESQTRRRCRMAGWGSASEPQRELHVASQALVIEPVRRRDRGRSQQRERLCAQPELASTRREHAVGPRDSARRADGIPRRDFQLAGVDTLLIRRRPGGGGGGGGGGGPATHRFWRIPCEATCSSRWGFMKPSPQPAIRQRRLVWLSRGRRRFWVCESNSRRRLWVRDEPMGTTLSGDPRDVALRNRRCIARLPIPRLPRRQRRQRSIQTTADETRLTSVVMMTIWSITALDGAGGVAGSARSCLINL